MIPQLLVGRRVGGRVWAARVRVMVPVGIQLEFPPDLDLRRGVNALLPRAIWPRKLAASSNVHEVVVHSAAAFVKCHADALGVGPPIRWTFWKLPASRVADRAVNNAPIGVAAVYDLRVHVIRGWLEGDGIIRTRKPEQ